MNLELIGKKLGMSQVYDEDNNLVPVTIIEAGPCPILPVKSMRSDGYEAIQIGFNPKVNLLTNRISVKLEKLKKPMSSLNIFLRRSDLMESITMNKAEP